MNCDYDAVILGGAFSGAATALMLKRRQPDARVLLVEKTGGVRSQGGRVDDRAKQLLHDAHSRAESSSWPSPDRKAGSAHVVLQWPDQAFDDCVEIGARYQTRLQTFQVDRATLDSHLLELAVKAGCDLWRPAKVTRCELEWKEWTANRCDDRRRRTKRNGALGRRCHGPRRFSATQARPFSP